jgi:hypothetical protein
MGYSEELVRLQKIITSDSSSEDQREKAREVKKRLIDDAIDQAFLSLEKTTEEYEKYMEKLKGVVNRIKANELTGVMEDLDRIVKGIKEAAENF